MKAQKSEGNMDQSQNTAIQGSGSGTVEVLYQKMGDRWFAFSLVNDEVFVGSITQEEVNELEKKKPTRPRRPS